MELVHLGDPTNCLWMWAKEGFHDGGGGFQLNLGVHWPAPVVLLSHTQLFGTHLQQSLVGCRHFHNSPGDFFHSFLVLAVGTVVVVNTGRNGQGWPGRERKGVAAADFDGLNWLLHLKRSHRVVVVVAAAGIPWLPFVAAAAAVGWP